MKIEKKRCGRLKKEITLSFYNFVRTAHTIDSIHLLSLPILNENEGSQMKPSLPKEVIHVLRILPA
ncbi:hypothetical protein [Paenibacillus assamensis]|uniref:hypothetical protein n=1 Tax=Paenibacillus assamensis TaxID=311244 RepID=UPI000424C95F|nr:hypothetical protein [Paenibacillus assamensis]